MLWFIVEGQVSEEGREGKYLVYIKGGKGRGVREGREGKGWELSEERIGGGRRVHEGRYRGEEAW